MRRSFQFQIRELILLLALVSVCTAAWMDLKRQETEIEQLQQRLIELQQKANPPIIYW